MHLQSRLPPPYPSHPTLLHDLQSRLLSSLQYNHALPFPYFQDMTEMNFFSFYAGGVAIFMGCSTPIADYYCGKYLEEQRWRTSTDAQKDGPLWERAEWSMPMRYIGGVVGFAWAVSVFPPCAFESDELEIELDKSGTVVCCDCLGCFGFVVFI